MKDKRAGLPRRWLQRQETGAEQARPVRPVAYRRIAPSWIGPAFAFSLALPLVACTPPGPAAEEGQSFSPPPPRSIVVLMSSLSSFEQLQAVIEDGATPGEALVVSLPSHAPAVSTYMVKTGDSLTSIGASHGLSLATLESENPHLGPTAGRNWDRIYPGDQVNLPTGKVERTENVVVTRAPTGPQPPRLLSVPPRPNNSTSFQLAQWSKKKKEVESTNEKRQAAWWAQANGQVRAWQAQLVVQLQQVAGNAAIRADLSGGTDLSTSFPKAVTTLKGLPGNRVLLVFGGETGPPVPPMDGTSLVGVHLVVANVSDPAMTAAWVSQGSATGAAVTVLDPALTTLNLGPVVNGQQS